MKQKAAKARSRHALWMVIAIMVLAAGLRLWGLTWGLPDSSHLFSYHPDEYHSLRGLFSFLIAGDFNPHFFNYGSLYLYLVIAVVLLFNPGAPLTAWNEQLLGKAFGDPHELLRTWTLDARLLTLVAALVTVYVVYRLGRRLMNQTGGLLAAGLLAVAPLHVLLSHYATVDVTQTLFITLALYFSVRLIEHGDWRPVVWAGVCAGLAASTKYNGGSVLVAPLLAAALAPGPRGEPCGLVLVGKRWVALLGTALFAFALTSPYTFLAWDEAKPALGFEMIHMRAGEALAVAAEPSALWFHLRHLLWPGLGLALLLGLFGAGWVMARRERKWYPLVLFAAVWLVMISLAHVRYPRYELPLTVPLVLLSVVPLSALCRGRAVWPGLWGLAAALALLGSLQVGLGLQQLDPRAEALAYITQMSGPQETVGLVGETWFADPPVDYCNGGQVLRSLPLWWQYRRPVRPLVITELQPSALRQQKPPLFLTTDFGVGEGLRAKDSVTVGFRSELEAKYRRVANFGGVPLSLRLWPLGPDWRYPWPEITIWQRIEADNATE